jgi:hypothetical protein
MKLRIEYYFIFLFVVLSFFFHFIYEPELYYNQFQSLFLNNRIFFYEFLAYPGGFTEWASLFVFQFFYFKWAGSLILAAYFVAIHFLLYLSYKRSVNVQGSLLLSSLPVILFFGLQLHYNFHFYFINKTLLVVLLIFTHTGVNKRAKIVFTLFFPVIYYLLGGWFFLLYTLFAIIYDFLNSRGTTRYLYLGTYILIYLLLPYLAARYWFIITLSDAYLYSIPYMFYLEPFSFKPSLLFYLFSFILVFAAAFKPYVQKIFTAIKHRISPAYSILLHTLAILFLSSLLYYLNFDQKSKSILKIEYYADQEKWEELIQEAQKIEDYDRIVNFHVNRAFCHLGDMLNGLFQFNQKLGVDGLFLTKYIGSQIEIPASDLYFDLGHINAARVLAYEAYTKYKYHPKVIKRLMITSIIQGDLMIAKKFNILLQESIVYKALAEEYAKYIEEPALIQRNSFLNNKRLFLPKKDFFINTQAPIVDLMYLIESEKRNRMAVDYLFAYYLLECNTKSLFNNLHFIKEAGYLQLPRHIEEAILIHCVREKINPVTLIKTYAIERNTVNGFIAFNKIQLQYRKDKREVQQEYSQSYRTTFWYYMCFGHPKITGLELKKQVKDVHVYKLY